MFGAILGILSAHPLSLCDRNRKARILIYFQRLVAIPMTA